MAARVLVISLFLSTLLMLAAHAVLEAVSLSIAAAALPPPTPIVTLTPTVSPTDTPTVTSPTPMSTPTVTPLSTPTTTVVPPRGTTTTVPSPLVVTTTVARHRHRHRYRRHHHHRHHRRRLEKPRPTPTATVATTIHATATGRHHKRWHVHQRSQAHHRQQRRTKAVPTPMRTPHLHHPRLKITLTVGNTVSPVLCSGPSTPHARPFLIPPYHSFVPIISYFDHDLPDFEQDGLIQLANGMSIRVGPRNSPFPTAADFPAYWSDRLRQYIYYDGHNGYDFGLVYQPVYAAAAGRVIFAGWNYPDAPTHGYGQMVMIDHGHGYITLYGHFSHILVHRGQHVHAGQEIGVSGNTGHSSGPHLHFTVFHNCTPTDPFGWSGPGPDPLTLYRGESSTYLWRRSPALLDLPPNWPGLAAQPAPPVPELVTLSLPSAPSLMRLLDQLDSERHTLATVLAWHHIVAHYDLDSGGLSPAPCTATSRPLRPTQRCLRHYARR
jgi:murein DD-endopeptidase MepM/ murein hydrolase activator NlpD